MNNFLQWIKAEGGPPRVAEKLGITAHAVRIWVRGEGRPKTDTITAIVFESKGRVTFADIANHAHQVAQAQEKKKNSKKKRR